MDLIYLAIVEDPNISKEQKEMERRYKAYVDNHIGNVKKAWEDMMNNTKVMDYINSIAEDKYIMGTVDTLIKAHDMSKYSIDEWEPYRKHFYPIDDQEKEDSNMDFEAAWEHHYMNNLHHWEYWARTGKDNMPLSFVIEECCDWIAMSMKFGGTAYNWYKSQNNIVLGKRQKEWTENILKLYYGIK